MVGDLVTSALRTYAPMAVGAVVAYLAVRGVDVSAEGQAGLVIGFTAVLQAVYYTVARLLERRYPQLGRVLLLSKKQPVYEKAA